MRHTLFSTFVSIVALLLSVHAYAQDIIVTTSAQKIEAKITEVSKSEIRYKEKDYLDGPTFIISTDEISSIIYANGKVVLYNQAVKEEPKQVEVTAEEVATLPLTPSPEITPAAEPIQTTIDESLADIQLLSGQTIEAHIIEMRSDHVTYIVGDEESTLPASQIERVSFRNGQVKYYSKTYYEAKTARNNSQTKVSENGEEDYESSGTIYKADDFQGSTLPKFTYTKVHVPGKKYKKNRYVGGNMILTESEFHRFLELYCPEAYEYYKKARLFLVLECVSILIGLVPVIIFAVVGINYSSKILPTYNNTCAGRHFAIMDTNSQQYYQDNYQLATVVLK